MVGRFALYGWLYCGCGESVWSGTTVTLSGMHYVSFLAVEADTPEGAIGAVEEFLEGYRESAYDWYAIGGRWSGAAGGDDLVCAGERRSVFDDLVKRGVRARDEEFNRIRQHFSGPDPRFIERNPFAGEGELSAEREAEMTERIWSGYIETQRQFGEVLSQTSAPSGGGHGLLGYYLRELASYLMDSYTTSSYFYDTVAHTNGVENLYERVRTAPTRQWVVVVDLHN